MQEEEARRDVQEVDDEVDHDWTATCEWTAKKMLKYLEDSEASKVSAGELKEEVFSPDESNVMKVRITRQARSENSKKLFQIFRQGANKFPIASMAIWEEHLKGLVVLERHCQLGGSGAFKRKTRSFGFSDGGQDEHAEGSTRRL